MPLENSTWIIIPDPDPSKESWVGQIAKDVATKSPWSFEVIRPVDPADSYRQEPFQGANNVIGLLDHQKPCTLIRPIVERIDPGRLDIKNKSQRTIITGQFQALLSDIPALDGDEKKFLGFTFESEALDAWHGTPTFDRSFNSETRTPTLDIKPSVITTFTVDGFGIVTIARNARVSPALRSSSLRSATIFKIDFEKPKSINEVIDLALGLERLFGFLVGFRGAYPVFTTWIANKIKAGEFEWNYDGTIEVGDVDCSRGEAPHPFCCVHLNGISGAELPSILERFLAQKNDILSRIHAVEFSRFFSRNLNDRFAVMMPILDSYIQARYKTGEEESYIQAKKAFFDWIDLSSSECVREFPKKHVSIKNKKAPGLKTLLTRAIEFVNNKGFCFAPELADRIQDRRGQLFHAAAQMREGEVLSFSQEVQAITGLLLLHTLEDLGIDIAYLADRYPAMNDMRIFMKAPRRDGETVGAVKAGTDHSDNVERSSDTSGAIG